MLTQKNIKALAKERGFFLNKKLGQNFLMDKNVRDKIISLIALNKDDTILEIGPGLGALTEELLARCAYVYAVEIDKKIYETAQTLLSKYTNLKLIHEDFLKFNIGSIKAKNIRVIAALPYYITSPIIEQLLSIKKRIKDICIIVQKEVYYRMAASAASKDYSSFSLFIQFHAQVEKLMDISRNSFFPVPAVDSCLVRLKVLDTPPVSLQDEAMLFKVIRAAFGQRRKTLLSALSHKEALGLKKSDIKAVLEGVNIKESLRAERLTLTQFANISDAIIDFSL